MKALPLIFFFIALAPTAQATHTSGSRNHVVGFSMNQEVMIRRTDVQHGDLEFTILKLRKDSESPVLKMDVNSANPEPTRNELIRAHQIESLGFPGFVAPGRNAAVFLKPNSAANGSYRIEVVLVDAKGMQTVTSIATPSHCASTAVTAPRAQVDIRWSPDSRFAVVAGALEAEPICNEPQYEPLLLILPVEPGASSSSIRALGGQANELIQTFEQNAQYEALMVARQWLAFVPESSQALLAMARIRAKTGHHAGAVSALWAIQRSHAPYAHATLGEALFSEWVEELKGMSSFRALRWLYDEQTEGPPPL